MAKKLAVPRGHMDEERPPPPQTGSSCRRHNAFFLSFAETDRQAAQALVLNLDTSVLQSMAADLADTPSWSDKLPPDWPDQYRDMRQCVYLWKMVRAGDEAALSRHFQWRHDPAEGLTVCYDSHPGLKPGKHPALPDRRATEVVASTKTHQAAFVRFRPGDVQGPAVFYITTVINKWLAGRVQSRLVWHSADDSMSMQHVPETTLAAVWLQFASAIAANKAFEKCAECGNWFDDSMPGSRKTRVYCSDSCKVKAYLKRKARACEMKTAGKSVTQIAAELETDKDTVKRWLAKAKGKGD